MSFIKRFLSKDFFIIATYSCHSKICVFGITAVINSSHFVQLPRCFYLFVFCGVFLIFFFLVQTHFLLQLMLIGLMPLE